MIDDVAAVTAAAQLVAANRQDAPAKPAKSADPQPSAPAPSIMPTYGFRLRVDAQTHEVIAVITDPVTHAPIREIPPEEMQTASKVIRNLIGPLIDKIA